MNYEFTNDWFGTTARFLWDQLIPQINPTRILEVGSYEGRSTCFLIEKLGNKHLELFIRCVDTWEGGAEHQGTDMSLVEQRFFGNIGIAERSVAAQINIQVSKGRSDIELAKLLPTHIGYYDFVYIDGSHHASDVLCDALLAFRMLRVGGVMCFDDYMWQNARVVDPLRCPKLAIDTFTLLHARDMRVLPTIPTQIFLEKLA